MTTGAAGRAQRKLAHQRAAFLDLQRQLLVHAGVDEVDAGAEHHVPAAFAMHRLSVGKSPQARAEPLRGGNL